MCARSLPRQLFFLQLELFYLWAACGAVHLGDRRGDLIGAVNSLRSA